MKPKLSAVHAHEVLKCKDEACPGEEEMRQNHDLTWCRLTRNLLKTSHTSRTPDSLPLPISANRSHPHSEHPIPRPPFAPSPPPRIEPPGHAQCLFCPPAHARLQIAA